MKVIFILLFCVSVSYGQYKPAINSSNDTGSFVDIYTNQDVDGVKTFTAEQKLTFGTGTAADSSGIDTLTINKQVCVITTTDFTGLVAYGVRVIILKNSLITSSSSVRPTLRMGLNSRGIPYVRVQRADGVIDGRAYLEVVNIPDGSIPNNLDGSLIIDVEINNP